jgi:hypothetical protein
MGYVLRFSCKHSMLIILGLPGVGKTLTAESVAQLAGKPLFSVGVSDIGLEGVKVEENLQKIFDLAGLWDAVLLLFVLDLSPRHVIVSTCLNNH